MDSIILWKCVSVGLYSIGIILVSRLICIADLDMHPKSSGFEKVTYCALWPILAVFCVVIVSINLLKDRKS